MPSVEKHHTCLIVDDNELDRLTILSFARKVPFLHITGVFGSAEQALEATQKTLPDVLLLDIDMPGISGLELRKRWEQVPACIFITAHPEYALEGFEAAALDFLVKPLRAERFEKAMERLEQFLDIRGRAVSFEYRVGENELFIKDGHEHVKLQLNEIIYLEALKDYTGIVTPQKKYCVLTPLGNLVKERSFRGFIRIHRGYAIQKRHIEKITAKEVIVHGRSLPIGRTYKDELDKWLKING